MVAFLKKFKDFVPSVMQLVILGVIALLALINNLNGNNKILDFLGVFLPLALMIFAVLLLVLKKQMLGAHLVLLITLFGDGFRDIIAALLSYHFNVKDWITSIDMYMLLYAIAGAYLILMVISYALTHKGTLKLDIKPIAFPLFVTTVFAYFCFGFDNMVLVLFTAFIAVAFGSNLGALAIMLAAVIIYPLIPINLFANDIAKFTTLFNWITYLASFYVVYVLVMAFIKEYKSNPVKLQLEDSKKEE